MHAHLHKTSVVTSLLHSRSQPCIILLSGHETYHKCSRSCSVLCLVYWLNLHILCVFAMFSHVKPHVRQLKV